VSALPESGPDVVVSAHDLRIAYGGMTVLDQVDIDIALPDEVVISGRSGSGKTSLLLVLAGLVPPSGGTVEWPMLDHDQVLRRAQIAMVFQAPSLIPELTASENVSLPLRLRGHSVDEAMGAAADALGQVGLEDAHGRVLPSEMSGGEQQRVSVARAIATRPQLLLADEPTGALDSATGQAVLDLLLDLNHAGTTLVVITHDANVAARLPARVRVADGRIEHIEGL
jgi:predicted ABC-type transport system involved in lysophospholipase L1 biosynthesis ATPase subunit